MSYMVTVPLIGILVLIGVILFLVGYLFSDSRSALLGKGLLLGGIPLSCIIMVIFYNLFFDIFTPKPSLKDLAGEYHIVKVTSPLLDHENLHSYSLRLHPDGTFRISALPPGIQIC